MGVPCAAMSGKWGLPSGIVTFVLTDIESSSELWDRSAEAMADALERHDRMLLRIVEAAGGVLLKHKGEGDSSLSVFGDPVAALGAAVDAQRALLTERWPGLDVRVRIAVHTGSAIERDGDYFGPTLNRGARLRGLAHGGQVLLSEATATAVDGMLPSGVTLDDRGRYLLRGLSRDEHVFAVVDQYVRSAPSFGAAPSLSTWTMPGALSFDAVDFVGRASELTRLRSAWRDVGEGRRRAVVIAGEPGIGKTRLAAEFARRVAGVDGIVLYGRCDDVPGAPYQPITQALEGYVRECPKGLLQRQAARIGGDLVRLVPAIEDVLGGAPASTQGDPDVERHALFDAALELLGAASELAPVLLVLDDFHWAAAPTVLLSRWLLSTSRDLRVLPLILVRETDLDPGHPLAEPLAELTARDWIDRIDLRGLSLDAVASLIAERGGEDLGARAADLAAPLRIRTGGNPFYLGQVMRQLAESRGVAAAEWTTGDLETRLPETVREVVQRRLARLSHQARRVLPIAAVIGSEFSSLLLEAVLGADDDSTLDALEDAAAAGMVTEAGPGRFVFSHALTRQALLDDLTTTRKMRLHRRVGDALRGLVAEGDDLEALAHHFAEAARDGRADQAAHYALLAGRRALERLAYEEAIEHFERGASVAAISPHPDRRLRAELELALTDAHLRFGTGDAVVRCGLAAADDARALGDPVFLARAAALTSFTFWLGQGETVSSLLREALERLGNTEPAWSARLRARLATEIAFSESDIARARPLAEQALAEARQLDDRETLAFALVAVASTLSGTAEVGRIASLLDELDSLLQGGDLEYAAHLDQLPLRASIDLERGDIAAFRRRVDEMTALAASSGWRNTGRLARAQQVVVAYLAGDFAEAEARNAELLERHGDHPNALNAWGANTVIFARDRGRQRDVLPIVEAAAFDDANLPAWRAALALLHADDGHLVKAREHYAVLLANDLSVLPDDQILTAALACLAEVALVLDDAIGAKQLSERLAPFSGLVLAQATSNFVVGVADHFLGMLATAQGDWGEADARFDAALRLERRLESPTLLARTAFWYGRVLLRRGEVHRANALLEDAVAIAEPLGMEGISGPARAALQRASQ
jgi:class 3 adenylate cyclase/tetratricopeptide (TPR) repeat protein